MLHLSILDKQQNIGVCVVQFRLVGKLSDLVIKPQLRINFWMIQWWKGWAFFFTEKRSHKTSVWLIIRALVGCLLKSQNFMAACSSRRLKRHELAYKRSLVCGQSIFFIEKGSHKTSVQLMLEDWMCAAKMFFFTEKWSHKTSWPLVVVVDAWASLHSCFKRSLFLWPKHFFY